MTEVPGNKVLILSLEGATQEDSVGSREVIDDLEIEVTKMW